jgi:formylglycine-generating enzyme required for sulfatase activity
VLAGTLVGNFVRQERPVPGHWVSIPASNFVMGMNEKEAKLAASMCLEGALKDFKAQCPTEKGLLDWSGRQVNAKLGQFSILDDEVTYAQYQLCVANGSCEPPGDWSYEEQGLNQPATNLNWFEAEAYCEWLGGRLPTEAEWEKAARGPNSTIFPWGNTWDKAKANLEHAGIATVQPIVQERNSDISGYNIKDMAGNVREWTASEAVPLVLNQQFKDKVFLPQYNGEDLPIIVRGGSWTNVRSAGMASNRAIDGVLSRRETLGFRCTCPEGKTCQSPWNLLWKWFGQS